MWGAPNNIPKAPLAVASTARHSLPAKQVKLDAPRCRAASKGITFGALR